MIFNINSSRGQTRFLTCVARVTCLVYVMFVDRFISSTPNSGQSNVHYIIQIGPSNRMKQRHLKVAWDYRTTKEKSTNKVARDGNIRFPLVHSWHKNDQANGLYWTDLYKTPLNARTGVNLNRHPTFSLAIVNWPSWTFDTRHPSWTIGWSQTIVWHYCITIDPYAACSQCNYWHSLQTNGTTHRQLPSFNYSLNKQFHFLNMQLKSPCGK